MTLNAAQLDAISQAMTQSDPTDTSAGDSFCGQLQDLNQILRAGILSDTETDAIMREIQKHPVKIWEIIFSKLYLEKLFFWKIFFDSKMTKNLILPRTTF